MVIIQTIDYRQKSISLIKSLFCLLGAKKVRKCNVPLNMKKKVFIAGLPKIA